MAEPSQAESTEQKTYLVVETIDEELQKLQQAGYFIQELQRALLHFTDEELQKLQLTTDRVEAAAGPTHHHDHDEGAPA